MIIAGYKHNLSPVGAVPVNCPKCGKTPMVLNHAVKKATVYWIPIFKMSEFYALQCRNCNDDSLYPVDEEHLAALKAAATPV